MTYCSKGFQETAAHCAEELLLTLALASGGSMQAMDVLVRKGTSSGLDASKNRREDRGRSFKLSCLKLEGWNFLLT